MQEFAIEDHIVELVIKRLNNIITAEESLELDSWLHGHPSRKEMFERLINDSLLKQDLFSLDDSKKKVLEKIHSAVPESQISPNRNKYIVFVRYSAVAAAILIAVSIYLVSSHKKTESLAATNSKEIKNDVPAPTGNNAVLILSNGKALNLDGTENGALIKEGAVQIQKHNGELSYEGHGVENIQGSNTLQTRRGGLYRLKLSDGSLVWLNASSSIIYPVAFSGEARRVSITGEAYFEIAPNPKKPFYVNARGIEVRVLGTHFNINAYDDEESVKTTLLEGKVKITSASHSSTLKPGQQLQLSPAGAKLIDNAPADEVLAWKEGYFLLRDTDVKTIMKMVEKWYDVTVIYNDNVDDLRFNGRIPRSEPLSELLKLLEFSNKIHFNISGKTVTVMP